MSYTFFGHYLPDAACKEEDQYYIQMYQQIKTSPAPGFPRQAIQSGIKVQSPSCQSIIHQCVSFTLLSVVLWKGNGLVDTSAFSFLVVLFRQALSSLSHWSLCIKLKIRILTFHNFFAFLEYTCMSCLRDLPSALFFWENISSLSIYLFKSYLFLNIIFI